MLDNTLFKKEDENSIMFNPRKMQRMMKQLGVSQKQIPATEVIIKTGEGELVIKDPVVTEVTMAGQKTFQIAGSLEERSSEEDLKIVMEKTGANKEKALEALEKAGGDIAQAIIELS